MLAFQASWLAGQAVWTLVTPQAKRAIFGGSLPKCFSASSLQHLPFDNVGYSSAPLHKVRKVSQHSIATLDSRYHQSWMTPNAAPQSALALIRKNQNQSGPQDLTDALDLLLPESPSRDAAEAPLPETQAVPLLRRRRTMLMQLP